MNAAEFKHAELSLIAYANLNKGVPSLLELTKADMAEVRAAQFQRQWLVVDEYSLFLTGLSATVFQEVATGKRYLAIRGSEDLADLIEDFLNIARLGSYKFSLQFLLLSTKVREWINDGTLPATFSVTGHSLGGFLASGLTAEFSGHVEHAYLFNSPGLDGLAGFATAPIRRLLGLQVEIDPTKVSNLKADAGISPIAGLGLQVAPPSWMAIENQLALGILNPPAALNHSQRVLTDSMAVYSVYQSLDATAKIADIGQLLKRASYRNADMLESGTFLLGKLFGQLFPPSYEDRDSLYSSLESLNEAITRGGYENSFRIRLLADERDIYLKARQSNATGLAYRYALRELNPFALTGTAAVYADHNGEGRLDLHDSSGRMGTLSEQWLVDRAKFLVWKNLKFERDIGDDGRILRQDSGPESYLFTDKSIRSATGGDLSVRVVGGSALQQIDPLRFTFGSAGADSLSGGKYADHLYGEGGDDVLIGGEGSDYLEGGLGYDTYEYESVDDLGGLDTIFDIDGRGSIVFDGETLTGGSHVGGNRYVSPDRRFTYALLGDSDGGASLVINDVIEVKNFRGGDLGITLAAGPAAGAAEYEYHYFGLREPIDGPQDDPHFQLGSHFNDVFQAGSYEDDVFIPGVASGNFTGKAGDDLFLGSHPEGGDNASGGAGNDILDGGALGQGLPSSPFQGGDQLVGGAGRDVILGGWSNDRLYGDWVNPFARHIDFPQPEQPYLSMGDGIIEWREGAYVLTSSGDYGYGQDRYSFPSLQEAIFYVLGIQDETELPFLYDDRVDGLEGDDHIVGGPGSDFLAGGDGDDVIFGDFDIHYYHEITGRLDPQRGFGAYAYLLGLPGDDILDGGDGNDSLTDGYGGSDALFGGAGDDMLRDVDMQLSGLLYPDGVAPPPGATVNILDGGDGDDDIASYSPYGSSYIYGGAGNDLIEFGGEVDGENDDETLPAPRASVYVDAGDGDDDITVTADEAEISGGAGSDSITVDYVNFLFIDLTSNRAGDHDELHFSNWHSKTVLLTRDESDLILFDQLSDQIAVLSGWFEDEAFQLDAIVLEDVTWESSDIPGVLEYSGRPTAGDDGLFAMSAGIVSSGEGNDMLTARGGPVLLDGGPGSDEIDLWEGVQGLVIGGAGDDSITAQGIHSVIAFNKGDGADSVQLNGGTISLGGGITLADLTVIVTEQAYILDLGGGDSLTLLVDSIPSTGDEDAPTGPLRMQIVTSAQTMVYDLRDSASAPVTISDAAIGGWLAYRYALDHSVVALSDELVLDVLKDPAFGVEAQTVSRPMPFAPLVLDDIRDQQAEVRRPFSLMVPADMFLDLDSEVPPALSVTRQDGGALPDWLGFDPATYELKGTPDSDAVGQLALKVSAVDGDGLSASHDFTISVQAGVPGGTITPVPPSASDENPAIDASDGEGGTPATVPAAVEALPVPAGPSIPELLSPAVEVTVASPTAILDDATASGGPWIGGDRDEADEGARVQARLTPAGQAALLPPDEPDTLESSAQAAAADKLVQGRDSDAESEFDMEARPVPAAEHAAPAAAASGPDPTSHGLTSWEITNALLQFHLDRSDVDAEDALSSGYVHQGLTGMGFSPDLLMAGTTGFGRLAGQPLAFAGLREGLVNLGEVRVTA